MKYVSLLFILFLSSLQAEELVSLTLSELKANQLKYSGKTNLSKGKLFYIGTRVTRYAESYIFVKKLNSQPYL